jgi:probable selenium-dependent hydroxylase accessory protein YqeC
MILKQSPLSMALNLRRGDRIALVGGGGKTSLLYALARENPFGRGLYTTTTKMFNPSGTNHPFNRILSDWKEANPPEPLWDYESTFISAGIDPENSTKVCGLSNKMIESWKNLEEWPILVIEADGASGRPIKAPHDREPVIPVSVSKVVGCIGLDVYGKKIDSSNVHRCELFREKFCREGQDRIDLEVIRNLILHPEGLFQYAPSGAEKSVMLNKMDCLESGLNIKGLLEEFRREIPSVTVLAGTLKELRPLIFYMN